MSDPYPIRGAERVREWLDEEDPDDATRDLVIAFIREMATAPLEVDTESGDPKVLGLPNLFVIVPGTEISVAFQIVASSPYPAANRCIYLLEVRTARR